MTKLLNERLGEECVGIVLAGTDTAKGSCKVASFFVGTRNQLEGVGAVWVRRIADLLKVYFSNTSQKRFSEAIADEIQWATELEKKNIEKAISTEIDNLFSTISRTPWKGEEE